MEVDAPSPDDRVVVVLPRPTAVVLFEVIARSLAGESELGFDGVEQGVLQHLVDALDAELDVAEREDYLHLLELSRRSVFEQQQAPRAQSPTS